MDNINRYPPFCYNPLCKLHSIREFQRDFVRVKCYDYENYYTPPNSKPKNSSVPIIEYKRYKYEFRCGKAQYFCDCCHKAISMCR